MLRRSFFSGLIAFFTLPLTKVFASSNKSKSFRLPVKNSLTLTIMSHIDQTINKLSASDRKCAPKCFVSAGNGSTYVYFHPIVNGLYNAAQEISLMITENDGQYIVMFNSGYNHMLIKSDILEIIDVLIASCIAGASVTPRFMVRLD